jgi:hypothetical protein
MKQLRITVLDMTTRGPTTRLFSRIMNPNYAAIMPQAIAVWCEQLGHRVHYACYTGREDITGGLAADTDVLILGAFTRSALAAYAIASLYSRNGAITVLGGPHARSYPEDSAKYFDYVLGFTDRALIEEVLRERAPRRGRGRMLAAQRQPAGLPGVRERWKFIEPTIAKAPTIKLVPMIASMGCPYTCSFCIDSVVDYQPLGVDQIQEDLRFLMTRSRLPRVAWHDPNFGVRFNEIMTAIEEAVPPGRVEFVAESSLSLLSEANLKRLKRNGFIGILPGIESWYEYGSKSKTGARHGLDKVRKVADHLNLILSHIPYVQANFVLGLDCDAGTEPFELTKTFLDLAPGAYPAFSLFTCYGEAAPLNLELQRAGRVLPTPFHFLDSNRAMNVMPLNYDWRTFYALVVDLARYALGARGMYRRFKANRGAMTRILSLVRAASSKRLQYQSDILERLSADTITQRYFRGESTALPEFYRSKIRQDLGALWQALPEGAVEHDQNAYLRKSAQGTVLQAMKSSNSPLTAALARSQA